MTVTSGISTTASRAIPPRRVAHFGTATDAGASPTADAARPRTHCELAERQAALVAALVAGAPVPAGLRPRPARRRPACPAAQAGGRGREALAAARRVARARAGPTAFAATDAGRAPGGALRDGWDLARALHAETERRRRRRARASARRSGATTGAEPPPPARAARPSVRRTVDRRAGHTAASSVGDVAHATSPARPNRRVAS